MLMGVVVYSRDGAGVIPVSLFTAYPLSLMKEGNNMKSYAVYQKYASIAYYRRKEAVSTPLPLGIYQGKTIWTATRKAAKDWKLPELCLSAVKVGE